MFYKPWALFWDAVKLVGKFDSLGSCLYDLQGQCSSLGLIILLYCHEILQYSPLRAHEIWCFNSWWEEFLFPILGKHCVSSLNTVIFNLFMCVFPQTQLVSSHTCTDQYPTECSGGTFWRLPELSSCITLFFPVPCRVHGRCLHLSGCSAPSPYHRAFTHPEVPPGFDFPLLWPQNSQGNKLRKS